MNNMLKTLAIVILSVTAVFAQIDRSKRPKAGPAPVIKIGDYQEFKLDNGLKVFVVENRKLPKVTFSLVVDRVPIFEGESAGYISIAGQLLGTATKTRTKDQIDEDVDILGARLNASSSSVNGSCLTKHLDKFTELFSDVVLNAEFKQDELDKVKKQTLSGLAAQKSDPSAIAGNLVNALVHGKGHPYGEIETEESVEKITLEQIKKYYQDYFIPNSTYLAIVGDISSDDAEELIEKYFGSWKQGKVQSFEYKKPKAPFVRKIALHDRSASVQSVIHFTYPVDLKIGSEDGIKVKMLNTILGGGFSSRLNQNLREKHGYTYGARGRFDSDEVIGSFDAYCEARNEVTDSVVQEMIKELNKLKNEKVSEKELESNKKYLTGIFSRSLEQPSTVARFALNIARYNLPKDYYANYLKNLNAVTLDDVQAMAKKYIKPENAHIIVVGNAEEVAEGLKKFSMSGKINYYDVYANKVDPNVKKVPAGVTVESVIGKYFEAIGGKEKYLSVKDQTSVMTGSVQGINLKITTIAKAPNKLFSETAFGTMGKQIQKFDGKTGRLIGMRGEQELTGATLEAMKVQADRESPFNLDKYGVTAELNSIESIDGADAYKIKLTSDSGLNMVDYYDVNTGLKIRTVIVMEVQGKKITMTTNIKDYLEQDGLKFPSKIVQEAGGQLIKLTVEKVEINTGVDDSIFN